MCVFVTVLTLLGVNLYKHLTYLFKHSALTWLVNDRKVIQRVKVLFIFFSKIPIWGLSPSRVNLVRSVKL